MGSSEGSLYSTFTYITLGAGEVLTSYRLSASQEGFSLHGVSYLNVVIRKLRVMFFLSSLPVFGFSRV